MLLETTRGLFPRASIIGEGVLFMSKHNIAQTFIQSVDRLNEITAKAFSWLAVALVLMLVYEVATRYIFRAPTIWAFDMSYMLYGSHFIMGAAYVLSKNQNVRADVFYSRFSPRGQAIIDASLYPILFFPAVIVLIVWGADRAALAWATRELTIWTAWRAPIYPFITLLPVAAFLLLLQGIAQFIRSLTVAIKGR